MARVCRCATPCSRIGPWCMLRFLHRVLRFCVCLCWLCFRGMRACSLVHAFCSDVVVLVFALGPFFLCLPPLWGCVWMFLP